MMPTDPYLIVRAGALYITVMATAALWAWRRPNRRQMAGALMAALWNLPLILALHLLAVRLHWWHFEAQGGLLLGMPVELYLSWAWLWGAIPALAFPTAPLVLVLMFAAAADLILMPAGAPVIQLGPTWWLGELAGLALGVLPGQLLSRWTARGDHLIGRVCLQMLAFSGLILFVLPAMAIDGSGTAWVNPAARPAWQLSLFAQALAVPVLIGLAAVQEFVVRGGGTPVPFDPPRRLVTTGVYAYVRNPMQLSAVVLLLMWGFVLGNRWVSAAAVMAHLYSAGLAGWDEDEDLRQRFGSAWTAYRRGVRGWVPRLLPWYSPGHQPARLYVSEQCSMCSEVGLWFRHRGVRHLAIVPAETHPSGELTRITYEDHEGTFRVTGVNAIARALGHLHFGWSVLGLLIGLPVISALVQLVADASGAGPRQIPRKATDPPAA
jgi:protein-S-isoprenylcysteine O-methyltransferase Ste14